MIQGRLVWPLCKDNKQIRQVYQFCLRTCFALSYVEGWGNNSWQFSITIFAVSKNTLVCVYRLRNQCIICVCACAHVCVCVFVWRVKGRISHWLMIALFYKMSRLEWIVKIPHMSVIVFLQLQQHVRLRVSLETLIRRRPGLTNSHIVHKLLIGSSPATDQKLSGRCSRTVWKKNRPPNFNTSQAV